MDFVQVLVALWHSLAGALGGDALALLFTVGFVVALVSIWLVVAAFRKTEFYKQHELMWKLVDSRVADIIWLIEVGDVDLTNYEKEAEQREKDGLSYIDPRMLYLLDQAQEWVKVKLGVELDFDELLARAEHIFDEVKASDTNSVGE